jgi:hypothetical protein
VSIDFEQLAAAGRHVLDVVERHKWAQSVAYDDPMFLQVESVPWSTRAVWVQFRSRCPRCDLRFTLSSSANVEMAYEPELRSHFREQWAGMLGEHVCLAKS